MAKTRSDECFERLLALRHEFGTSDFDRADLKLRRMRIDPDRVKRKHFSNATVRRLYNRQSGLCSECGEPVAFIKGQYHVDHKDPNLTGDDFNREPNLRLAHATCNLKKGSQSIYEQAKSRDETILQTLQR